MISEFFSDLLTGGYSVAKKLYFVFFVLMSMLFVFRTTSVLIGDREFSLFWFMWELFFIAWNFGNLLRLIHVHESDKWNKWMSRWANR